MDFADAIDTPEGDALNLLSEQQSRQWIMAALRQAMSEQAFTWQRLVDETGLPMTTLYRLADTGKGATATIKAAAVALGRDPAIWLAVSKGVPPYLIKSSQDPRRGVDTDNPFLIFVPVLLEQITNEADLLAVENRSGTSIRVDSRYLAGEHGSRPFAVTVPDRAMEGVHIIPGDTVLFCAMDADDVSALPDGTVIAVRVALGGSWSLQVRRYGRSGVREGVSYAEACWAGGEVVRQEIDGKSIVPVGRYIGLRRS